MVPYKRGSLHHWHVSSGHVKKCFNDTLASFLTVSPIPSLSTISSFQLSDFKVETLTLLEPSMHVWNALIFILVPIAQIRGANCLHYMLVVQLEPLYHKHPAE